MAKELSYGYEEVRAGGRISHFEAPIDSPGGWLGNHLARVAAAALQRARLCADKAIAIRAPAIRGTISDLGGAQVSIHEIEGGYRPSDDEIFMNERQREYFRRKLIAWKEEILRESQDTLASLQNESASHSDLADRASSETDRSLELRARDRQRKLIAKIEAALNRLNDGTYGYCEETGEPISLKRLDARPIATLSLEAQERHERRERTHRES
jgi:DnaK suppressor protein